MTNEQERALVRSLAQQVAAFANSPENETICRRWRDVNALCRPDRPPVWCRPVGAWQEIMPEDTLSCADPWLRSLERQFRQVLIKREIDDDDPLENGFPVHAVFDVDPPNTWGLDIGRHKPDRPGGAWKYDPPLKTEADFDRLRLPTYAYNDAKTQAALSKADELLGDILPVRLVCHAPLSATLCNYSAYHRGLTETMMDMAVAPELMHRLMAHFRDGVLKVMREVEAAGLLTPNNTGPMNCSDPIGPATTGGTHSYKDLWCMANSQEFDQVSPAMWEEFLLNYQKPIFERFGLCGYGCCENLTKKIDGVLSIPNLRIFVCSAWTDLDKVIERVGKDHVIMWRQKASDVVFPRDISTIARDLNEGLRQLKGCHVQVVLRELQTLAGHRDRLHMWARLAKEAAARHC